MSVCGGVLLAVLLCVSATSAVEVGLDFPIPAEADQAWINSLFYLPTAPRLRREYRTLSDDERRTFHNAVKQMKEDTSVNPNKYTLLASIHGRRSSRNAAHKGPGFLGWHRVFMLLLENALREKVPDITVPYWDCTLDAELPTPRRSALFSGDFIGNGDGYVISGTFKDWTTQAGRLFRTVGRKKSLIADSNITTLLTMRHMSEISFPNGDKTAYTELEDLHNHVHNWVGGEMDIIETAADDPNFFIYHSFVDYLYQMFRDNQRDHGVDPVTDYVEYYGQARHHLYSPMGLGKLMVIDGFSDVFERNIVYAPQPACSKPNTDCKSDHLWCNTTIGQCVAWTIDEYNDIKSDTEKYKTLFTVQANIYKGNKLKGKSDTHGDHDQKDNVDALRDGNNDMANLHDSGETFGEEDDHHDASHEGQGLNEQHGNATTDDHSLTSTLMVVLYLAVGCLIIVAIVGKCSSTMQANDKGSVNMGGIVNLSFNEGQNNVALDSAASHSVAAVTVEHGYARVHIERTDECRHDLHAANTTEPAGGLKASRGGKSTKIDPAKCDEANKNGDQLNKKCPTKTPCNADHKTDKTTGELVKQVNWYGGQANNECNGKKCSDKNIKQINIACGNKQNINAPTSDAIKDGTSVCEHNIKEAEFGKEHSKHANTDLSTINTCSNLVNEQGEEDDQKEQTMPGERNDKNMSNINLKNNDRLESNMSFGRQFYKNFLPNTDL